MAEADHDGERAIREAAYYIWEREGRPEGRSHDHWRRAVASRSGVPHDHEAEALDDEEKLLAGRPDVNLPALLTRDVPGG